MRRGTLGQRKKETIVALAEEWVLHVGGKGVGKRDDIY